MVLSLCSTTVIILLSFTGIASKESSGVRWNDSTSCHLAPAIVVIPERDDTQLHRPDLRSRVRPAPAAGHRNCVCMAASDHYNWSKDFHQKSWRFHRNSYQAEGKFPRIRIATKEGPQPPSSPSCQLSPPPPRRRGNLPRPSAGRRAASQTL